MQRLPEKNLECRFISQMNLRQKTSLKAPQEIVPQCRIQVCITNKHWNVPSVELDIFKKDMMIMSDNPTINSLLFYSS